MKNTLVKPEIRVIQLKSCLNAANKAEFEQELSTVLANKDCNILLVDLEKLQFIDSSGLMVLISGLKLAQLVGCRFSLCSISPAIKIIFELTQLNGVFEILENSTELI
jgi:anti-anti-sigma factor